MSLPRTVLCFGDSNTYGTVPGIENSRYAPELRWPGVLARELGPGWRVIEEGLPGRTTIHEDPLSPHRRGADYLPPCLASHAPLDAVVIFLGTNDLKSRFAGGSYEIAQGIGLLAGVALTSGAGPDGGAPRVVVLGLPRLAPIVQDGFEGAGGKAEQLPARLEQAVREVGAELLQLADLVSYSPLDGVHLDADGHAIVGAAVARRLAA
jgi:lysophospholipase L1-like esterase